MRMTDERLKEIMKLDIHPDLSGEDKLRLSYVHMLEIFTELKRARAMEQAYKNELMDYVLIYICSDNKKETAEHMEYITKKLERKYLHVK